MAAQFPSGSSSMVNVECYICGDVYHDRVRLGIHISQCYNEAVGRGEKHPHPLDLMDDQHYTAYMKNRKANLDARKHVDFDGKAQFDAMKKELKRRGPPSVQVKSPVHPESQLPRVRPQSGGGPSSPPQRQAPAHYEAPAPQYGQQIATPSQQRNVASRAPPARQPPAQQSPVPQPAAPASGGMGITKLKSDLELELQRIREIRLAVQDGGVPPRPATSGDVGATRYRGQETGVAQSVVPSDVSSPAKLHGRMRVGQHEVTESQVPLGGARVNEPQQPMRYDTEANEIGPKIMPDGRVQCEGCGKLFGPRGYTAHRDRCVRGADDFTYSKDARAPVLPKVVVAQQSPTRHHANQGAEEHGGQAELTQEEREKWMQFMQTYPRPILDEKPKTAKERNQAMEQAKQRAELANMMNNPYGVGGGGAAEPTGPCRKCGRSFVTSRLGKHEAVCKGSRQ